MKIYLAGPITGLTYDEGQDWRVGAAAVLFSYGITGLSPLRSKEFLKSIGKLEDNHAFHPLSCDAGIVTRDRNDVMTSDAVLMNLLGATRISLGSMIEVGWADAFRKPLVVVMEKEGNPHEHGMLRHIAGYRVETLQEGLAIAATVLGCNNVRV